MASERDRDFETFFRREFPAIVREVFVLTADRGLSEDVAQEALARLCAHWARVSRYDKPGAWVRRVAINIALSSLRRRFKSVAGPGTSSPDPADPDLHRAILMLPRAQRAAIVLHYFEDRPIAEIGTILGCSTSTVKVHLHRARNRLEAILSQEAPDAAR